MASKEQISEKERQTIEAQAKRIMDNFAEALEKAKISGEEAKVERPESTREETEAKEPDKEFRTIVFSNAPNKKGDFILAEKGHWTGK